LCHKEIEKRQLEWDTIQQKQKQQQQQQPPAPPPPYQYLLDQVRRNIVSQTTLANTIVQLSYRTVVVSTGRDVAGAKYVYDRALRLYVQAFNEYNEQHVSSLLEDSSASYEDEHHDTPMPAVDRDRNEDVTNLLCTIRLMLVTLGYYEDYLNTFLGPNGQQQQQQQGDNEESEEKQDNAIDVLLKGCEFLESLEAGEDYDYYHGYSANPLSVLLFRLHALSAIRLDDGLMMIHQEHRRRIQDVIVKQLRDPHDQTLWRVFFDRSSNPYALKCLDLIIFDTLSYMVDRTAVAKKEAATNRIQSPDCEFFMWIKDSIFISDPTMAAVVAHTVDSTLEEMFENDDDDDDNGSDYFKGLYDRLCNQK
jgi:hypothetical protein